MTRRTPGGGAAGFPRRYLAALRAHLEPGSGAGAPAAEVLGLRARALGIGPLELARVHDAALATLAPSGEAGARARRSRALRADGFFEGTVSPGEAGHRALARKGAVDLAFAQGRLVRETDRRRVTQEALTSIEGQLLAALERSRAMEEELRLLSRRLLKAHEDERMRISRELHDTLGQTLASVNLGLASLTPAAMADPKAFRGSVARTRRLVLRSMRTVHEFARSLRPTLLDDFGLVPALHAFVKEFGKRNDLATTVEDLGDSSQLDADRRTALFRVAQEALVNVGRHAGARHVRVTLRGTGTGVRLEVWNDGTPFNVARALGSKTNRHLGLLCMRERMEMVGGTISIRSSRKAGTTVRAEVPLPAEGR